MAPAGLLGRTDELAVIGDVIGAFPDGDRALVAIDELDHGLDLVLEKPGQGPVAQAKPAAQRISL